jgi:hypothetical protein
MVSVRLSDQYNRSREPLTMPAWFFIAPSTDARRSFGIICVCLLVGIASIVLPATTAAQLGNREPGGESLSGLDSVPEGERLSREGDRLLKEGREQDAARMYLAAHETFQKMLLHYFEQAFRSSLGGPPADEDTLTKASTEVASLRNVNLSKLWVVLDPEDRAFEQGLEAERAGLLSRFDEFRSPPSAEPLDRFLRRLYPDDPSGDRQMDALHGGSLPSSKRWTRLGIDLPTQPN